VAIVAAAVATKVSMDAAGIHARDYPVHLVARDLIDHNINVLAHALAGLGNGDVSGLRWGPVKLAHLAGTGLTIAALAAVMWTAGREIAAAAVARAEGRADGCGTPVRTVWLTFWAVSATALAVSFVATTAPEGTYSNRYLVGVLLAVTAVLPLAVERSARARVLLAVGVAVFALIGVMSLLRGEMTNNPLRFPTRSTADALAAFARARGLAVGYAGYWDAPALTWSAGDDRLRVYPVTECAPEHRLCPPSFHRISTWYRPRPRTRTFLVLHPALSMEKPTAPDLQLGAPVAVDRVGPLTVYTYNYDIAARMGGVDPRLGAVTA
jgi:hypothetical protein